MSLVETFFTKDASLEFIPAISLKRDSNTEVFLYGFFTVTLFKLSEIIFCEILCKTFSGKVAGFQSIGCDFIENNVFDKKYLELAFKSKGYLYCVKKFMQGINSETSKIVTSKASFTAGTPEATMQDYCEK